MDNTERFSARVEAYVKYRPGYPPAMLDFLADELAMGPASRGRHRSGHRYPDGAAGPSGGAGLGSGAESEMRVAAQQLLAGVANVGWSDGRAEVTGLPDGCVDLVTVAQAFHWFDRPAFKQECRRLLRPGGRVALIWNDRLTDTPFLKAYEAGLRTYSGDYERSIIATGRRILPPSSREITGSSASPTVSCSTSTGCWGG